MIAASIMILIRIARKPGRDTLHLFHYNQVNKGVKYACIEQVED